MGCCGDVAGDLVQAAEERGKHMTWYGYIRVSSRDQVEGQSPEVQEQIIRGAAQMQGVGDVEIFRDDGVSGSVPLDERPQGAVLLARLQPGDTLVASKLERAFRSVVDTLVRIDKLQQRGVSVILCDVSIEPVTNNGVGRLFITMLSAVAEFERFRLLERTAEGRRAKASKGGHVGGCPPYGYKVFGNGKDAVLVPEMNERVIVERAKSLERDGLSLRDIADSLGREGHKTRKGTPFAAMQVKRILEQAVHHG